MQEPQEMRVQSLGREDPLEEDMATYSSILAWRIPWTEEPGGLHSMGSQGVGHKWIDLAHMHLRSKDEGGKIIEVDPSFSRNKGQCSSKLTWCKGGDDVRGRGPRSMDRENTENGEIDSNWETGTSSILIPLLK